MGSLILCQSRRAEHPYYVEELGIHLYSGEELSYFIYHNLMLIQEDFLDERLFRFIGEELGMTVLEGKLRKWEKKISQGELLLVILQDIHYYNNAELRTFREELSRIAKAGTCELMKEKADYLMGLGQYYGAIRLYDQIFAQKGEELEEAFLGRIWYNKGCALARIFSYDHAIACYEKAYELLSAEEALRRIYEIHLLSGNVRYPEKLLTSLPEETLEGWKDEWEEIKEKARLEGQAGEASALLEKDAIRRAAGFERLIQTWKAEYRRSQGQ